jgi:hypothetical protein
MSLREKGNYLYGRWLAEFAQGMTLDAAVAPQVLNPTQYFDIWPRKGFSELDPVRHSIKLTFVLPSS